MYGMIHRAARDMVRKEASEAVWDRILKQSALKDDDFVSALAYPDDLTFRLIGAVASEMGLSVDEALVRFGRYWIEFANSSAYSPLMMMAGDNLLDFCENLDRMHASIMVSLPDVDVPSFRVIEARGETLRIVYISSRTGLEPFVIGLFEGLLTHFGQTGQVRCDGPKDEGIEFTVTCDR
jgi:hypothetical protein